MRLGRSILAGLVLAALIIPAGLKAHACIEHRLYLAENSITVTPNYLKAGCAGAPMCVDFGLVPGKSNQSFPYVVAFSKACQWERPGSAAAIANSQTMMVSGAGIDVAVGPAAACASNGNPRFRTTFGKCSVFFISVVENGCLHLTVPASFGSGTWYVLVAVAQHPGELDLCTPNSSPVYPITAHDWGCAPFTVDNGLASCIAPTPAPTGIQNVAFSSGGNSNPVGICVLSPTITPTFSISPTRSPCPTDTVTSTATDTPSPTSSASPTATPTNSATATPSPTASSTSTPSPTATPTSTDTASPTVSSTATVTSTSSATVTLTAFSTATDSLTISPSSTVTPTATASATQTMTPTASATATQTCTGTATPSVTLSSTASPIYSATITPTNSLTATASPSATASATFTSTSSVTPTETATTTFTASPTPTATASFTLTCSASPSATASPSSSFSPTSTATSSASPTSSMTGTTTQTPSASPTNSVTATVSISPTQSQTWTASPTQVAQPYHVAISIYNSAGEKVRSLFDGAMSEKPSGLEAVSGVGGLQIFLQNGASTLSSALWDATNDNGQSVSGGTYYVKVDTVDNYGHIVSFSQGVPVVSPKGGNSLAIFNGAGELVREIPLSTLPSALVDFRISRGPVGSSGNGGAAGSLDFALKDASGTEHPWTWDGLSSLGQPVQSGTYLVRLVHSDAGSAILVKTEAVTILALPGGSAEKSAASAIVAPQPYAGASSGQSLSLRYAPLAGAVASVKLYDLAGEWVGQASDPSGSGSISLEGTRLAGGIYLIDFELRQGQGLLARRVLKLVVTR